MFPCFFLVFLVMSFLSFVIYTICIFIKSLPFIPGNIFCSKIYLYVKVGFFEAACFLVTLAVSAF